MRLKEIKDDTLYFDDGTEVTHYHEQDCCEHVWADFGALKDTPFEYEDIKEVKVESAEGWGCKVNGYLVPCYNSQSGYYSGDLEIVIKHPDGKKTTIDVTNGVIDCID